MIFNEGKSYFLLIRNEKVGGSIPLSGTNEIKHLVST